MHSGQLLERLQAASLVDARAAHLENLIGRLMECQRPTTSLHYRRCGPGARGQQGVVGGGSLLRCLPALVLSWS